MYKRQSLLCAGSVYEDISSGFFLFQKLRVGRIERYVISKIAANMFLVTTATIGGILLFVAFVRPLMPLVGNNPQQDIVEYYDIYQTLGPILYLAAMGLIFGLSASFFTSFGLWIVFYIDVYKRQMFGYSNWNWQYQDIYLESKFPEEGDEKDKKKAIDYGRKLMEDLDFSYSEISTYFMGIESVKALDMDIVAPGYTEVGDEEVNDRGV